MSLYFCLGVHPYALSALEAGQDRALLDELGTLVSARPPRLCAIGECGLDFRPGRSCADRERQVEVVRAHLALARATGLPLVLHGVSASAALYQLLLKSPLPASVLHSYSGSAEMAARFTSLGHLLSFSGSVTKPGARRLHAAARAVDDAHLLVETDSPDQLPHGRAGEMNQPAYLRDVVESLARLRGTTVESIAQNTYANACRVYAVDALVAT